MKEVQTDKSSILVVGNPNSGKTLLFNRLTGLRHKVANFPGVTVELSTGSSSDIPGLDIVDFPGIYSLKALTKDEEVAVESLNRYLQTQNVKGVLCVLDGTRLERSLFLALQLQRELRQKEKSVIFVVNMMDQVRSKKSQIDTESLSRELGAPVLALSAKTKEGFTELVDRCRLLLNHSFVPAVEIVGDSNDLKIRAKDWANKYGPKGDLLLSSQYKIDHFVLSSLGGGLFFILTMMFLFQSIFSWASPIMDATEALVGALSDFTLRYIPEGIVADFTADAIFGGIGSFVVFVPQIFVLTFIIGILEDSGYLARAAIICHKPLSLFGLSGKSFIPLLSGHACAIPAVFASRTIESPRKRLLTMLAIPLMACSARLPVYGLLISALIPAHTYFGGAIGLQGLSFFGIYFFSILVALLITGILNKTLLKKETDAPFVLELPAYRVPGLLPLLRKSLERSWSFVRNAGPTIFWIAMFIWVLGYFPSRGDLSSSYLATLGHWIEPVFAPLGLDWKFGVAILMSFLAREVFVGTLGTLRGLEGADEDYSGLADQLQASMTVGQGVALLVFYAIAMQCVATLAVLKKELGSWKIPVLIFVAYGVLAYLLALLAYALF